MSVFNARRGKTYKLEDSGWHPHLAKKFRPSEVEPFLTPYSYPTRPIFSNLDLSAALTTYESSHYLNACLDVIMQSVGSVPVVVKERAGRGKPWEPNEDHPLQILLDRPNPFITWRQLIERVAGHLYLSGNALWSKNRVGGTTVELWPLNPDMIKIKPHPTLFIESYQYGEGQKAKIVSPEDIVHFTRINLEDLRWGSGYTAVGRKLFDMDASAMDWNQTMMVQRGIYTNVIGVKHPLTAEQYNDLRTKVATRRLGGVEAGQDLIIGADVVVNRIGANAQEMDYINSRKLTRQDIASLMGVPLPMIGIYDDATLANIGNARKIFWQDRVIPFLRKIEDIINLTLVPEFGDPDKLWVQFNVDDVEAVRSVKFEKTKEFNLLVNSGVKPRAANQELQMGFKDEDVLEGFVISAAADESGEQIAPVLDPNKLNVGVAGESATRESERGRSEAPKKPKDEQDKVPQRSGKELYLALYQEELETILEAANFSSKNELPDLAGMGLKWYAAFSRELPADKVKAFWLTEMEQKMKDLRAAKKLCDERGRNFGAAIAFSYIKWAPQGAESLEQRVAAARGRGVHVLSDVVVQ